MLHSSPCTLAAAQSPLSEAEMPKRTMGGRGNARADAWDDEASKQLMKLVNEDAGEDSRGLQRGLEIIAAVVVPQPEPVVP